MAMAGDISAVSPELKDTRRQLTYAGAIDSALDQKRILTEYHFRVFVIYKQDHVHPHPKTSMKVTFRPQFYSSQLLFKSKFKVYTSP
jgi:hypothetical protein